MSGDCSAFPVTKWAQRKDLLLITFCVEDCENTEVRFERNKIVFHGQGGNVNKTYGATLELLDEIDPKRCKWTQTSRSIFLHVGKRKSGPFWSRLLSSKVKQHWLKIDFDKWQDEDDLSEDEDDARARPIPREMWTGENDLDLNDDDDDDDSDDLDFPVSKNEAFLDVAPSFSSQTVTPSSGGVRKNSSSKSNDTDLEDMLRKCAYSRVGATLNDVLEVSNNYQDLKREFDMYTFQNGQMKRLLCLAGTIPVMYKYVTYNIPIAIWVMTKHPSVPPVCFVKPTPTMEIRVGKYVDAIGRIQLPYLTKWKLGKQKLVSVVRSMKSVFGNEPPVVSKPPIKKKRCETSDSKASMKTNTPEMMTFEFHPPLKNMAAQNHLISFIKQSPEHLAKLEREMKSLASITLNTNHVVVSTSLQNTTDERSHKSRCINILKDFFSYFAVQTQQVRYFDAKRHDHGDTNVRILGQTKSSVQVSVAGPTKEVAKKIHDIKLYAEEMSTPLKVKKENETSQVKETTTEENSTVSQDLAVPNWLLKYIAPTLSEVRAKWPKVRVDFGGSKITYTCVRNDLEAFGSSLCEKVIDLLKIYACEAVRVPKEYHRNVIGKQGAKIQELRRLYNVEVTVPRSDSSCLDILVEGKREDVELAKKEISKLVVVLLAQPITVTIALEEKYIIAVVGHNGKFLKAMVDKFQVHIFYTTNPAEIHINGKREKVGPAQLEIEKVLNGLGDLQSDFVVMEITIDQSQFGKLIGKGGCNMKRMLNSFPKVLEIILPERSNPNGNVYLTGDCQAVDMLFRYLEEIHSARLLGYVDTLLPKWVEGRKPRDTYPNVSRFSRPNTSSSRSSFDSDDNYGSSSVALEDLFASTLPSVYVYTWEEGSDLLIDFVTNSSVHMKKLIYTMSSLGICSIIEYKVTVEFSLIVGKSKPDSSKLSECERRLKAFFENYAFRAVAFPPLLSVDRTSYVQDDMVVEWSNDSVIVRGLKTAVDAKVEELEKVKNKRINAEYKWYYGQKGLLEFVQTSPTQMQNLKENLALLGSPSIIENQVIISEEILEVEEDEWRRQCKEKLRSFFANFSSHVIQFHPLSSVDRKDSMKRDVKVTWNGNKTCVTVCGLKMAVEAQVAALESVKKRKKSVSCTWRCTEKYLLNFVKESSTQLEQLQNDLADIGSPVFADVCIVVNGEIMETSSSHDWEDKCKKSLDDFFAKCSMDKIEVPPLMVARACRLGENRPDVVTKWAEDQNSLVVYGLQYAVKLKAQLIRKIITEFQEEENDGYVHVPVDIDTDASRAKASGLQDKGPLVKLILDVTNAKAKCLQAYTDTAELQNVDVKTHIRGIMFTGKKSDVLRAKRFADSIMVKELVIQKYGVFELLTDNSLYMEVIGLKFNCTILVERIESSEADSDAFKCIRDEDALRSVYGKLVVTVEEGDITNDDADMIVNTTDKSFSFAGPLSQAIMRKAGNYVRWESKHCGRENDMVSTTAGNLQCKRILHVAIPNIYESMDAVITKILTKAEIDGMTSVTLPTIGAGGGGWSSDEVARSMHTGILKFQKNYPRPMFLKKIKVMIFTGTPSQDKLPFYTYLKCATTSVPSRSHNSPTANSKAPKKGLFSKIFNLFLTSRPPSTGAYSTLPPQGGAAAAGVTAALYPTSDDGSSSIGRSTVDGVQIEKKKTISGDSARVLISSNDMENVEKAKEEVNKFVELHWKEFELRDKAIWRLKQHHVEAIEAISHDNNVRIVIDCRKDKRTIKIQGRDEYASKANDETRKIVTTISTVLPDFWEDMGKDQKVIKVRLSPVSKEFKDVNTLFTSANESYQTFHVISIERIQNPSLYQQYQLRREEISERVQNPIVERQLFHGTTDDTVDQICTTGFDRGYAGKNATVYGRGVYFCSLSSYSNAYSRPSMGGRKYMFLANVLTGDYCVGVQDMPAAPNNPGTNAQYDSAVDSHSKPSIFVVFKDAGAYPSYIITYLE